MRLNRRNSQNALTLIEALVVLAVLALIVSLLLPKLARARTGPLPQSQCINNLKQVGLGFRQWALDYNGQYPMELSMTNGGTKEFVSRGGVYLHFRILADEINTPKILACPADKARQRATYFSVGFSEANISYFVGVDANQNNPSMFLAGDRNLTNGALLPNRMLVLQSNSPVGWTKKIHKLQGNVCLADGSVQSFSSPGLGDYLNTAGGTTNRLAMPLD